MNKKTLCLVIVSLFFNYSQAGQSVTSVKLMASIPAFLVTWEAVKNNYLSSVDYQKELIKPLQAVRDQGGCFGKLCHKNKAEASEASSQSGEYRQIGDKGIKDSNKLLIKTLNKLGEIMKKNSDIYFLFVMDIDETLVHSVENEKAYKQQQEWLLRLDKLARKNNNFIIVYNTARPMEFNSRLLLSFEKKLLVDCGDVYRFKAFKNMLLLPLDNTNKLPDHIGIPVPDVIVSNLGMVFQLNPSLINKMPSLEENIKELNRQLLSHAEECTKPLINKIKNFVDECKYARIFKNGHIFNPIVYWRKEEIKNEWLSRMPLPNREMLSIVIQDKNSTFGMSMHNQYLVNKGTGLRIAIGLLSKAGRIKEDKKTLLISFGDSPQDLPFLIPDEEVSSLGKDDYTSEAKQEREQKIRAISEATAINIPTFDINPSLYKENDSLTWLMSVVFYVKGGSSMHESSNEAIDRSLTHGKLVHVEGVGPDLLVRGMERVVEKLKEYFNQQADTRGCCF
ncbi:hypothetical protein [Endozoicomonas euniceicola]|uniref:VWFA domain-containing protein n=1 Tax=Endozoicomonas euniceicola TaxID=1234143 RepID=A0ABY6GPF8_9GAMM|nr:hypothetical protein [Endozoicomonas euniceicola]UYM14632.1 hypothetical protein NX720_17275 [Endozoicomonas euniceicola]